MKISVALCTYNGARYLTEQLQSISAQDRAPDEIIIRDDRSTDGTAEIVAEFSRSAPFPVSFSVNPTQLGVTSNFVQAIGACSGDIIFLCDQDDVWAPAKVRMLAREFEADDGVGLVFSNAAITDDRLNSLDHTMWDTVGFDERAVRRLNEGDALGRFIRRHTVTGATVAFRASLMPKIVPIPPVYLHDAWIALVAAACSKVVAINSPLIMYRQHGANVVGGKRKNLIEKIRTSRETPALEFDREIDRNRALFKTLNSLSKCRVDMRHLDLVESKIRHLSARREMFETSFRNRITIAARELGSGRYFEFSSGISSLITDLFLHR